MFDGVKRCPECSTPLVSDFRGKLLIWKCPDNHGVGVSLLDSYGKLQEDELEAIRVAAPGSPASRLRSPISGKPMAEVSFLADGDSRHLTTGVDAKKLTIEVDVANQFGWFTHEELEAMATDTTGKAGAGPGFVGLGLLDESESQFDEVFADVERNIDEYAVDRSRPGILASLKRRLRT